MIVATRRGTVKIWVTHQSGRDFLAHTFVDVEFETASSPADLPSDPAGIGFWGPSFMNQQPMHTLTPEMWVTGAILAAYRRLPDFVLAQRKARWADTDAAATRALSGAHVLVVGAASIGAAVAHWLEPFGVDVSQVARRARREEGVHGADPGYSRGRDQSQSKVS